jgi:hypothetical protein
MFPDRLGDFRSLLSGSLRPLVSFSKEGLMSPENLRAQAEAHGEPAFIGAESAYVSASGKKFTVELVKLRKDADAYSLFTQVARRMRDGAPSQTAESNKVGTASLSLPDRVAFFKGRALVRITALDKQANTEETMALARLFADTLDKGEGEVPVLVKHLPDWEKAQERAAYAVTLHALQEAAGGHPVFEAINFAGGAEAVTAPYGQARLVIVENTTPQLATDNDARIQGRLRELREQGQSVPTAYQRVGNYSVFVFDAPDEQAAAQLIKGISYEQVVQWLGDNPRALERAQRQYTETTASIIVSVLKASGLSILLCLGIGGLFGGLVFRHRRAQQAASAAYSDAGDMVRLNIDGMSAQRDPARLLGRGDG